MILFIIGGVLLILVIYKLLRINYKPPATAGVCHICDGVFNDNELSSVNEFYLCENDLKIFNHSNWVEFFQTESSPTDPEQALYVQELKDNLKSNSIPSYIITEYKQVNKEIVSIFTLFVNLENLYKSQKLQKTTNYQ
jgi:hypothetical protein